MKFFKTINKTSFIIINSSLSIAISSFSFLTVHICSRHFFLTHQVFFLSIMGFFFHLFLLVGG